MGQTQGWRGRCGGQSDLLRPFDPISSGISCEGGSPWANKQEKQPQKSHGYRRTLGDWSHWSGAWGWGAGYPHRPPPRTWGAQALTERRGSRAWTPRVLTTPTSDQATYGQGHWFPARSAPCSCRKGTFGKRGSFYAFHWLTAEEEKGGRNTNGGVGI